MRRERKRTVNRPFKVMINSSGYHLRSLSGMKMLEEKGFELTVNPYGRIYHDDELRAAVGGMDAVIADTETWDEESFQAAKDLKCLIRFGTGMNSVDLAAARRRGVVVANTPGHNANAVAEQTVALFLNLVRWIPQYSRDLRQGKWSRYLTHELAGKRLGILGFGAIGQKSAAKMEGWELDLAAYDKFPNQAAADRLGVRFLDLEEIFATSDFLFIHLPLLPETENLIRQEWIGKMKDGVVLVNSARGPIVNEEDTAKALKSGKIGGMASDVFATEPLTENPLTSCWNFICSPHIAGETYENMEATGIAAAQAVIDFYEGREPAHRFV